MRIGNAGYKQLQLDIYGEMMDSLYLASKYGDRNPYQDWQNVQRILGWLGKELASGQMKEYGRFAEAHENSCIRALCAGLPSIEHCDSAEKRSALRSGDRLAAYTRCDSRRYFHKLLGCGTEVICAVERYEESRRFDVLLMPLMRFISPVDPMWRSTMKAIEERLVEDTLVHRYEAERTHVDGVAGGEGTFTACSSLVYRMSRKDRAIGEERSYYSRRMLGYANHLGLYSEELGANGQHLGNFPQALTHLALISAATYLDRALSGTDDTVWR